MRAAGRERLEVGQPVVAGARGEVVVEDQRAQRGVTAGAAATDHETLAVHQPLGREMPRRVEAVHRVDDAPGAVQPAPVLAPVPGAPAVVHVHHGEAPAGEELHPQAEGPGRLRGRPSVAHHHERGELSVRPLRVAVGRRVEVRERGEPALRRELDRPGRRQEPGVDRDLLGLAQHLHGPGREVDHDHGRRGRGAAGHDDRVRSLGGHVRIVDRGVRQIQVDQLGRRGVEHGEMLHAAPRIGAHDAAVRQERVAREPEPPVGPAELGLAGAERHVPVPGAAIKVPPSGAVAHEVQVSRWAPRRLHDRLLGTAGDAPRVADRAVRPELAHPQLRAVPRHPRVIPAEPRQSRSVGRDPR